MKDINENLHVWYTYWLIIDKDTMKGIGFVVYKGSQDEEGLIEIGYSISPIYRKRGLMTESLKAITEWTSAMSFCKGIRAAALKSNIGSNHVLCNCGFYLNQSDDYFNYYVLKFNS